jgi:MFS family permease
VGRAFGLHRSLDQAGAIVGPVIAFSLMPLFGIRGIFWLSFIPGIIALMILLFYVREKRINPRKTSMITNFRDVLHGKFLLFMIMTTIFSLGAFNFSFILLESIELGLAAAMVPLVYAVINVTHTAVGYPAGRLSDKIGGEKVLTIGFALFFLTSLIGFLNPDQIYIVFIMGVIFGLYFGIAETTQRAIIPKYVKREIWGTAYGVYYLIIGISFLVANSVVGTLWDNFGAEIAFSYSMVMSTLGIIGMIVFSYTKR